MVGCCVIGCKSRGDAHFVSFFRTPQTTSNPQWTQLSIDRRTLWLEHIGRSGDTISDNLRSVVAILFQVCTERNKSNC